MKNYFSSGATVCRIAGLCYFRISDSIYAGAEYHELSLSDFGILNTVVVKLRYMALLTILSGKRTYGSYVEVSLQ